MADKIKELVEAALNHVNSTSSLEDISKALEIAKSATENAKTNLELRTSVEQIKSERLKTWASILVPIVSIVALLATVLTQMYQQHSQFLAGRQQAEDTQWRELLATLQGGSSRAISDISLVPRLKTFFNSPTYGSQVRDVSKRLMGNLTNEGAFRDIYAAVFPEIKNTNLDDLVDISRIMARTGSELYSRCVTLSQGLEIPPKYQDSSGWGICSKLLSEDDVIQIIKNNGNNSEILDTRHAAIDHQNETRFLSKKIMLSAKQLGIENSNKIFDISGLIIFEADAKDVNFSRSDISRSIFTYVDLTKAKLTPAGFQDFDPTNSNWWDAEEIDQSLLQILLQFRYPGYINGERIATTLITKDYYAHHIELLCKPLKDSCKKENLLYEDRIVAVKPQATE